MCTIFGDLSGNKEARRMLFACSIIRGQNGSMDGSGAAWIAPGKNGGESWWFQKTKKHGIDFLLDLEESALNSKVLLGHTRGASRALSAGNASKDENSHPFVHGNTMLAHNGMIRNWRSLEKGIADKFCVDSDAFTYLVNQDGFSESIKKITGTAAIWYINTNDTDKFNLYCWDQDLVLNLDNNGKLIAFASEERFLKCAGYTGKFKKVKGDGFHVSVGSDGTIERLKKIKAIKSEEPTYVESGLFGGNYSYSKNGCAGGNTGYRSTYTSYSLISHDIYTSDGTASGKLEPQRFDDADYRWTKLWSASVNDVIAVRRISTTGTYWIIGRIVSLPGNGHDALVEFPHSGKGLTTTELFRNILSSIDIMRVTPTCFAKKPERNKKSEDAARSNVLCNPKTSAALYNAILFPSVVTDIIMERKISRCKFCFRLHSTKGESCRFCESKNYIERIAPHAFYTCKLCFSLFAFTKEEIEKKGGVLTCESCTAEFGYAIDLENTFTEKAETDNYKALFWDLVAHMEYAPRTAQGEYCIAKQDDPWVKAAESCLMLDMEQFNAKDSATLTKEIVKQRYHGFVEAMRLSGVQDIKCKG